MPRIGYRLAERFSEPLYGEGWKKYIEFLKDDSGRAPNLREVVGLDAHLNGSAISWHEDDFPGAPLVETENFGPLASLEHLAKLSREAFHDPRNQVLAALREPTPEQARETILHGFVLKGFDLIDDESGTSALSNCGGGWPDIFPATELSECGLISTLGRAYEIRDALSRAYPNEPHAQCAVWAIWRFEQP